MPCILSNEEVSFSLGYQDQADIATANAAGEILWDLPTINSTPALIRPVSSDDARFAGKGHPWARTAYPEALMMEPFSIEMVASAEMMAWAAVYGLGATTDSGTAPNLVYTSVEATKAVDGCLAKYFTLVQKGRAGSVLDEALIGCALEGFELNVASSPERTSATLALNIVGSGRFADPSGLTTGATPTLVDLKSASLALTANGVDFVTTRLINSLRMSWTNNLAVLYRPGSGVQTVGGKQYAVAGDIERVDTGRGFGCEIEADYADSDVIDLVRSMGEGTAVFSLTDSANRMATVTLQRIRFADHNFGGNERGITVNFSLPMMYHASNGLIEIVSKCGIESIGA